MEAGWIQVLLQWVTAHPGWSYLIVFAIALGESIFVLGLLVPGAFLLFGVGAMIPSGAIRLDLVLAFAIAGAFAGDCFSYWLGRHFRVHLYEIWPLRNYPALTQRGEAYFRQHGGKSVLFGRFVGAVRPIIPAVAGVAGMRPLHFLVVDLFSAILWAPCYILPGALLSASLGVAAEVASRLVVIVLLAGSLIWLVIWITRRTLLWLPANAERMVHALLDWSERHRVLGRLGRSLTDPAQPEAPGLAILAFILLALGWLCLGLLWGFGASQLPPRLDALAFHFFHNLRTPGADIVAMAVAQLGDWKVYAPVSVAVLIGLLSFRRRRAAAHWLAALLFSAMLAMCLSLLLGIPAPIAYFRHISSTHFAAGHVLIATVVYGFLPVLLGSRLKPQKRWRYYGPFFSLIALIGLAQLYLGAQWLSDALLGMTLGFIWVSLLTLGYRRHRPQLVPETPLLAISVLVFAGMAAWQWSTRLQNDLLVYQHHRMTELMSPEAWKAGDYSRLPAYRLDLRGGHGHPLNLQWAGTLDSIRAQLLAAGWKQPPPASLGNVVLWFSNAPSISRLPVLPQVHDGLHQALMMRYVIDSRQQWVIRLWPSNWKLLTAEGIVPLWVGSVSRQRERNFIHIAYVPLTRNDYDRPLVFLRSQLDPAQHLQTSHARSVAADPGTRWDGTVLLIGP